MNPLPTAGDENTPMESTGFRSTIPFAWWMPVLMGAMAGGLGWGIRGQYGHGTGAMMAGLLVSLVMVLLFCPMADSLRAARAVGLGTMAISIGGSMTYGQTVGLTHNPVLVGNWEALRWGMLGLAVKGGAWIGFSAAFLGMGLSRVRYRMADMAILALLMIPMTSLGYRLLNQPFNPGKKELPRIYFSADWRFEPDNADLRPRREIWGGLWFALAAVLGYVAVVKRDRFALAIALWGILGGAIGFPLGQSLQAWHAWNKQLFAEGAPLYGIRFFNWWNFMETVFGCVWGGMLGLGLWRNRSRIDDLADPAPVSLPGIVEAITLAAHVGLVVVWNFFPQPWLTVVAQFGVTMSLLPMVLIAGGKFWPYFFCLPVVAMPIAGKTLRNLGYEEKAVSLPLGWSIYVALPLILATALAAWHATRRHRAGAGRRFAFQSLIFATWLYFALNYAFFRFPWPWAEWTGRTPNAIVFTVFAAGITLLAAAWERRVRELEPTWENAA